MELTNPLFPDKYNISPEVLYQSLGSFWTQIFSEKGTIKGYTLGQAEELTQSYYKLLDTINSFSIKHIPVFSTVRWQPLIIKKSKYNKAPFKFISNGAVFGAQPEKDRFYARQTFSFGSPKAVNAPVYSYAPEFKLRKFSVVSDRIIAPQHILLNNVDILMDAENVLYFNKNIFELPDIPKALVVGENGEIATFVNAAGNIEEDTFIILWVYHAENDEDNVYENFGSLLDIRFASSEGYKKLLSAIFDLFVEGPTINSIRAALGAFSGISPVLHPREIIEDTYADNLHKYVVTDKSVYKFKTYQNFTSAVRTGGAVYAGDLLVDAVEYFDVVSTPNWWETKFPAPKLGLSSHIFLGNYKQQLFFKNSTSLVTYNANNEIVFPVEGEPADVKEFHSYINSPSNKPQIQKIFNLTLPGNVSVINPVDFIFTHFLKNCTALIKLNFNSAEEVAEFFEFLPILREYLPPHVYLLFYANLNLSVEVLDNFNNGYRLTAHPEVPLSLDGSLSDGMRPQLSSNDTNYYKDYLNRLFCVSVSPKALNNTPLHYEVNLDEVHLMSSGVGTHGTPRVVEGKIFTHIPTTGTVTNREIPTVLIIDFS